MFLKQLKNNSALLNDKAATLKAAKTTKKRSLVLQHSLFKGGFIFENLRWL